MDILNRRIKKIANAEIYTIIAPVLPIIETNNKFNKPPNTPPPYPKVASEYYSEMLFAKFSYSVKSPKKCVNALNTKNKRAI